MTKAGGGGNLRDLTAYVAGVYAREGPDIRFWRMLDELGNLTDERLADLIEEDGRARIARGLEVTIERYLEVVPDLLERCEPIDAAIDVTLRSRCGSARFDEEAVEALIEQYPQIESVVREAVALNNAMRSSFVVNQVYPVRRRRVPQDFGPQIETGEQRYQLRRVLGIGSTGQVYLAVDRLLSEKDRPALVAIKVLNPGKRNADYRDRFIAEARKARRVDHPNVVRVLDLGTSDENEDYIAYEYVTGGDLYQWIQDQGGPSNIRAAVMLIATVARGVQAAHSAGLVHCDLNPGNIILTSDGSPKIADFGVATRAEEGSDFRVGEDGERIPIGNLLFISPEQIRCEDDALTFPSDVYALGGLLFALLTDDLPNGRTEEEAIAIHRGQGRAEAPSLRAKRPAIDRDLEAICRRALAPRREDRYSSAGAFADDLETWLRVEPIAWMRPSPAHIARLWVRRRPALAAMLLLLLLSIVSLGGYGFAENQRRQAEELRAVEAERAREQEEHRAELETIRAQEQTRINALASQKLSGLVALLRRAGDEAANDWLLPTVWNIEFLLERELLLSEEVQGTLSKIRIGSIEKLIEQADKAGRSDYLETMLWRTTLALWLVAQGDVDSLTRAEEALASLEDHWPHVLNEHDPWLNYVEAIRACAHAKRLISDQSGSESIESARERLGAAHSMLERHAQQLGESDPDSPVYLLIQRTISELQARMSEEANAQ